MAFDIYSRVAPSRYPRKRDKIPQKPFFPTFQVQLDFCLFIFQKDYPLLLEVEVIQKFFQWLEFQRNLGISAIQKIKA